MEATIIKVIQPRYWRCCKCGREMFRASVVTVGPHGAYHRDIPSNLNEKERSRNECGCESIPNCNFQWMESNLMEFRAFSVSQIRQICVLSNPLKGKWASSVHIIFYDHDVSTSTLARNVNAKAVASSGQWPATVMNNFVHETISKFSEYVPHCSIRNTQISWQCTCTIATYNTIHWLYNITGDKIFNDIWTTWIVSSTRLKSNMSNFLEAVDHSPVSLWNKWSFAEIPISAKLSKRCCCIPFVFLKQLQKFSTFFWISICGDSTNVLRSSRGTYQRWDALITSPKPPTGARARHELKLDFYNRLRTRAGKCGPGLFLFQIGNFIYSPTETKT